MGGWIETEIVIPIAACFQVEEQPKEKIEENKEKEEAAK